MSNILSLAYNYAKEKHDFTEKLYNNKPYIVHPKLVSLLLAYLNCDTSLISAGVLHDVIEDCGVLYEELRHLFGSDIADLVLEVTKDENGNFPNLKTERGLILKQADRLANCIGLLELKDKKKRTKLFKKYSYAIKHEGDILKHAK